MLFFKFHLNQVFFNAFLKLLHSRCTTKVVNTSLSILDTYSLNIALPSNTSSPRVRYLVLTVLYYFRDLVHFPSSTKLLLAPTHFALDPYHVVKYPFCPPFQKIHPSFSLPPSALLYFPLHFLFSYSFFPNTNLSLSSSPIQSILFPTHPF